jgi:hypothetical protein
MYDEEPSPRSVRNTLVRSKENFADSVSAGFQQLSASIGRFSTSAATNGHPLSGGKIPSAKNDEQAGTAPE